MNFISLEPFVPSGSDFEGARQFFEALGFQVNWDGGDYVGFQKDACRFILQKYNNRDFAENFMLSVRVENVDDFYTEVLEKQLPQKFGIHMGTPTDQPYGREVNIIDLAGVCWHFIQQ